MAFDRRQEKLMKILHIAVHMGAGVGKAISGIALSDKVNEYNIFLLDEPFKCVV